MISLYETKVPEVEIDPGPHQHPVVSDHVNKSLPKMIIHETMVVFMTWIGYMHKLFSSCLAQLNFNPLAPQYFTSSIIPQHHPRNALTFTKENYLYHDHYMIPEIQFQTSSNRNSNYYKFGYTITWKGVRFKTLPFKLITSAKA